MKLLILAAGYGTRLYPLTKDKAKPLLEVGEKAIIEHILDKIADIDDITEIFIVTNNKFYTDFVDWSKTIKFKMPIKIINDQTMTNEDRLGAIGDIHFVVQEKDINDDLLVIAGDNMFGFALSDFVEFFHQKKSSVVAFHDLKSVEKVKGKYGVGILNGSKVVNFEEKPLVPKSSLASTACYFFKKSDLPHLHNLIKTGKADASGNLITHLAEVSEVHGFVFDEHWFDIGSFESLKEAQRVYEQ